MENVSLAPNTTESAPNGQEEVDLLGFFGTKAYRTTILVLLSVVVALGVLGNFSVISAVLQRHKNIKSPSNYLIMNIAVADLLVAIIVTPLRFVELYHGWPLGSFLCHFLAPLQDVVVSVSVVTHTVIAFERYRGIVQPFKTRMSLRRSKQTVGIIWFVCYVATGLPLAFVLKEKRESIGVYSCHAYWPSHVVRQVFIVYLVAVFIAIPLVIQTYSYSVTVAAIKSEIKSCSATEGDVRAKKVAQQKAHVVRMLILLVVAFQMCSIPRAITMLLWDFVPGLQHDVRFQYAITITLIIYYLKHVVNPFIIFASSAEFRVSCCYCLLCGLD